MKKEIEATSLGYPFPASKSMAEMMDFVRQPDWKMKIDESVVKKLRIATNNEPKVVAALRFLGVIDKDGMPTPNFDALKKDYKATLNRLVKANYGELFTLIPPTMMTKERVRNHFGTKKQTDERRMRFFMWVCGEAGIELPNLEPEKATKKH
ncbi:MAG: DUF5343 domain-containing protein [Chloroflexi bacterium]|nr:DUF5343 domain-containing protein [Chloroflexota bacterium]